MTGLQQKLILPWRQLPGPLNRHHVSRGLISQNFLEKESNLIQENQ